MVTIYLIGIDRPGVEHHLALRGIRVEQSPEFDRSRASAARVLGIGASQGERHLAAIRQSWSGVAMLMVRGGEAALVAALDAGFDDAVAADSSDALIAARLAGLVRWHSKARHLRIGDLVIDTVDCRVTPAGLPIALLPREYRLLIELARCPGVVVSRQALVTALCGLSFDPGTKVIEVHVSRLRSKIDRGFGAPMVMTAKGHGYWLAAALPDRMLMPPTQLTIAAGAANR